MLDHNRIFIHRQAVGDPTCIALEIGSRKTIRVFAETPNFLCIFLSSHPHVDHDDGLSRHGLQPQCEAQVLNGNAHELWQLRTCWPRQPAQWRRLFCHSIVRKITRYSHVDEVVGVPKPLQKPQAASSHEENHPRRVKIRKSPNLKFSVHLRGRRSISMHLASRRTLSMWDSIISCWILLD